MKQETKEKIGEWLLNIVVGAIVIALFSQIMWALTVIGLLIWFVLWT